MAAIVGGILMASAVPAQPVAESVEGLQRVCSYPGQNRSLTGISTGRQYRIGLGQNCPSSDPTDQRSSLVVPPTARLVAERSVGENRECTYEQGGAAWLRYLPMSQMCPMAAGMLPANAASQASGERR